MEQGSYLLIQPGMTVRDREGGALGTVAEVVADPNADIFRGLTLSTGLFSANVFVPEDRVASVVDDIVTLNLDREGWERLRTAPPPVT